MKHSAQIYIVLAVVAALWCMAILAAPMLKHAGRTTGADMLYTAFSRVCHQDDARSFHIEGEKLGVCFRCSAIYFGFLLGLLALMAALAFKRKFAPAAGFFFLIAAPMLADVALDAAGIHASTMTTRVLTGALFGTALPWLIAPIFVEACIQLSSRRKNHSIDSGALFYARKTK